MNSGDRALTAAASIATILALVLQWPMAAQLVTIGCVGAAVFWLFWKRVTTNRGVLARRLLLATTPVITILLGAVVWFARAYAEQKPPTIATPKHAASQLKIIQPVHNGSVDACTSVSGTGQIPVGYQIWVANLNDSGGYADTTGLFNLKRGTQAQDEETWHTEVFSVGSRGDDGKEYWIFVYLLPEAAGSVIENRWPSKTTYLHLKGPIAGGTLIDKIRVERTSVENCPWDPQ